MNWIKKIFGKNKVDTSNEKKLPPFASSKDFIDKVYIKREKEIESLLKYDRGEKTIHPTDLKSVV